MLHGHRAAAARRPARRCQRRRAVVLALLAATALAGAPVGAGGGQEAAAPGAAQMRTLARGLVASGDFLGAIEAYRALAEAQPADAAAHHDLAGAYAFVGLMPQAAAAIREAIRLAPDEPRYHALANLVYLQMGQYALAAREAHEGARLGDVQAMFTLVSLYEKGLGVERDPRAAVRWAERAAEGGHLGAMALLVRIHGQGLYEQPVDEAESARWAAALAAAERALDRR